MKSHQLPVAFWTSEPGVRRQSAPIRGRILTALVVILGATACRDVAPPTNLTPDDQPLTGSKFKAAPHRDIRSLTSSIVDPAIVQVIPSTLTITGSISLDDLPVTSTNHNGILDLDGGTFAERFAGQALSLSVNNFDVLSGSPNIPLSLKVGASGQNVVTFFEGGRTAVGGLGPLGFPNANAIGEGAIAVLFDEDQFELGFGSGFVDGGTATLSFFRRNGTLIETLTLQFSGGDEHFAFRRAGSVRDIAGFSIHNDDPGGTAYHSFRIDEPGGSTNSEVVTDEQGETDVTVEEGDKAVAGVRITVAEDALVTVRFEELEAGETCHTFLLGQTGRCLEITAKDAGGDDAELAADAIAGLCVESSTGLDLYKFEERDGPVKSLEQVDADFLDCSGFESASAAPKSWLGALASGLAKSVGKWIGPKPLYAAHNGFGGKVESDDGFSFFTWAAPIQVSDAVFAVNMANSGRDGYEANGTFSITEFGLGAYASETGFNPASTNTAANTVTVAFGAQEQTILPSSFKWVNKTKRWEYSAPKGTLTGVIKLTIDPNVGLFTFDGAAPTQGVVVTSWPFSLQIGHRTEATLLECGADSDPSYVCKLHQ